MIEQSTSKIQGGKGQNWLTGLMSLTVFWDVRASVFCSIIIHLYYNSVWIYEVIGYMCSGDWLYMYMSRARLVQLFGYKEYKVPYLS